MRYPGPLTFIVRDSTTHPNTKDYRHDAVIATHISRTRRRWTEEKRRAKLQVVEQRQSLAKVAIPRIPRAPAEIRRKIPKNGSGLETPTSEDGCSSHSCSTEQCGCTNTPRASSMAHLSDPPLALLKGNSDPFSASALPITADIHELLQLSSQFFVFWSWSVSTSSLFRAKAIRVWLQSVRSCIQGTTEMHVILAGGASVRAGLFEPAENQAQREVSLSEAVLHKTHALRQLRQGLPSLLHENSGQVTQSNLFTILRLVSLEFHEGNYQAALWHHSAIKKLMERVTPSTNDEKQDKSDNGQQSSSSKQPVFAVAEVWTAAAALQRPTPCGMVDWEGERRASQNIMDIPSPPTTRGFFLFDVEWPALHTAIEPPLRPIFVKMQKMVLYMERISLLRQKRGKEVEVLEAVSYLDAQGTKLRAEILGLWMDFNESKRSLDGAPRRLDEVLFSASCLSALLFINIIFMYKPVESTFGSSSNNGSGAIALMSPSVNRQALRRLQKDLEHIHWHRQQSQAESGVFDLGSGIPDLDSKLLLWLGFVAALGELLDDHHVQPAPLETYYITTPISNPGLDIGYQTFKTFCIILGSNNWKEAKATLKGFLYHVGLMDEWLMAMFQH